MDRPIKRDIFIVFLLSFIVFSICFPEYHIFPSVCLFIEYFNQGYISAAMAANQFYNGGIQLWDRYDQMPYAYYALTIGIYKIFEVLTTFVYACLSPFIWDQAKAFHHIYSFVFVAVNLFLKAAGSYLLLKRFVTVKSILYAAVIFVTVFFSRQLVCDGSYFPSFYPLAIHLALNVFEKKTLKDLVLFTTYMVLLISYSTIYGFYLYCNLHFLLILACIFCLWENRKNWQGSWTKICEETKLYWPLFVLLALLWIFMMAPNLYMIAHSLKDFYFNEQASRVHDMWSTNAYLTKVVPPGEPIKDYIWLSSRFLENNEGHLCPFSGGTVIFFSLAALIFSSDKRKYIFLGNILFLLTLASTPSGILADSLKSNVLVSIAHGITIWTNPFKFVLRDFHEYMTHALPFLFMPLAVMGMEAVYVKYKDGLPVGKSMILLAAIYLYGVDCLLHLKAENFIYVLGMLVLMTVCVFLSMAGKKEAQRIKMMILASFFAIDMTCSYIYTRGRFIDHGHLARTQSIVGEPSLGSVGLKYVNPQILPFRQYFTSHLYDLAQNNYLTVGCLNYPGKLYDFTNFSKNFLEWDPHLFPRPLAFASLPHDPVSFNQILSPGPLIYEEGNNVTQGPEYKFNVFSGTLNTAKKYESEGLELYAIPLPGQCPSYEASTFLTMDKFLLRFSAELLPGKFDDFSPVQGQIVSPMTFDVNNIRKGWIIAGFPKNQPVGRYSFSCAQPIVGVTDIWKNQEDNLGFNYNALTNGQLIMLSPYDPKWQIKMDGQPIKYYKANHAFITFPISQGQHKILMQYWPQTPLRALLMISMVLSTITLIGVIYLAMAAI